MRVTVALLFFIPLLRVAWCYDSFVLPKWVLLSVVFIGWVGWYRAPRTPCAPWWVVIVCNNPLGFPLLALVASLLVSLNPTHVRVVGQLGSLWIFFMSVGLCWYMIGSIKSHPHLPKIGFVVSVFAGVIISIYIVIQHLGWDWTVPIGGVPDWRGRLGATLGNPNFVGGYLGLILPGILIAVLKEKQPLHWWLWLCALVLVVNALTLVFTVGVWVALGVVLVIVATVATLRLACVGLVVVLGLCGLLALVFRPTGEWWQVSLGYVGWSLLVLAMGGGLAYWQHWQTRRMLAILSVFLVAWGWWLVPWTPERSLHTLLAQARSSGRWVSGVHARAFILQTTRSMIRENPWFGVGYGNYLANQKTYQGEVYRDRGLPHDRPVVSIVPQTHNLYYHQPAETGVFGTFALWWLLVAAGWSGVICIRKHGAQNPMVLSAWLGLAVAALHSSASYPWRLPATALLSLFLLAVGLSPLVGELVPPKPSSSLIRKSLACVVMGVAILPALNSYYLKKGYENLIRQRDGVTDLRFASQLFPWQFETHLYLARAALQADNDELAEHAIMSARQLRDSHQAALLWRDLALERNDWEQAIEAQHELLRYNPCWADHWFSLAALLRMAGDEVNADHAERIGKQYQLTEEH